MSKDSNTEGSFDLDRLKKLLQMMEKYGVTEVNLQREEQQWKVRRGPKDVPMMPPQMQMMPMQPQAMAPQTPAAGSTGPAAEAPAAAPAGKTIDSPTVGTFYASPNPDDPEFVSVGSNVSADTIVCIVEAMKVMNQIPAEISGKITEVLVKNGDPVDFGQPLFRVE